LKDKKLLLGAHVSIAGGVNKAFARAEEVGCTAMQIFTRNANQWRAKPLTEEDAQAFREAWEKSPVGSVIVHDSYLINLASPDDAAWEKSKAVFVDEMERCAFLGIPLLVMHPGAHVGSGEEAGIKRVIAAFEDILARAPETVKVLLENTAGQGTCLGRRFEELAAIMVAFSEDTFGVCFDTCHAFAAGYDISTLEGYEAVMEEFDRVVGIDKIKVFHANDCKKVLGARVDRHEHVGQGTIGREGFRALMRDERFLEVPKIIETPPGKHNEFDLRNLALLRELAGEG
jgi:deoxyribonuclease IV